MSVALIANLGSAEANNPLGGLSFTATANAPAGSFVVTYLAWDSTVTQQPITDSAGNTYSLVLAIQGGGGTVGLQLAASRITHPIVSGTTVFSTPTSTTGEMMGATAFSGVKNPSAYTYNTLTGQNSATPSIATPAGVNAHDLAIATWASNSTTRTLTEPSGWTTLQHIVEPSGATSNFYIAYSLPSSGGTLTWQPTINGINANASMSICAFHSAGGSGLTMLV